MLRLMVFCGQSGCGRRIFNLGRLRRDRSRPGSANRTRERIWNRLYLVDRKCKKELKSQPEWVYLRSSARMA